MFSYIKGKLIHAALSFGIIEAGGIGYKIFIPVSAYPRLPRLGEETILYTSLVVRETTQQLYGFLSIEERDLFEELTNITGVGPKTALNLIGHLSIEEIRSAVGQQDITALSRVPGIGKKTAERLIVEMRDRFAKFSKISLPSDFSISIESDPRTQQISDAINALINLGYTQQAAQKAIKKSLNALPESIDLASLITHALKNRSD